MTERYVQKVDVELRKGARRDQILGIVLELMGLGLIPVAIYVNYWVFAAAAVAFAFGVWLMQKFYSSPKEYEYAFGGSRLVISRANILGRSRRMAEIALADIRSFEGFYDMVMPGDIIAAENTHTEDVKALVFSAGGREHRLLFAPDVYLVTLLNEKLKGAGRNAEAQ